MVDLHLYNKQLLVEGHKQNVGTGAAADDVGATAAERSDRDGR